MSNHDPYCPTLLVWRNSHSSWYCFRGLRHNEPHMEAPSSRKTFRPLVHRSDFTEMHLRCVWQDSHVILVRE